MTTDTTFVNIINNRRHAITHCLDEIACYVNVDYDNIRFWSADDLFKADINDIIDCVRSCSNHFERRTVDQYLTDIKLSTIVINCAINTNSICNEVIQLNKATNLLSRIAAELDSRVHCDD